MADSNKIKSLAAKAADDALTMADDPADDVPTILDGAIVCNNPLKGNGSDGADDADDVSAFCSGEGDRPRSGPPERIAADGAGFTTPDTDAALAGPEGAQRCAQCGQPGGSLRAYGDIEVRLHRLCERAWIDAYEASLQVPSFGALLSAFMKSG
jgi:hypothetical protein